MSTKHRFKMNIELVFEMDREPTDDELVEAMRAMHENAIDYATLGALSFEARLCESETRPSRVVGDAPVRYQIEAMTDAQRLEHQRGGYIFDVVVVDMIVPKTFGHHARAVAVCSEDDAPAILTDLNMTTSIPTGGNGDEAPVNVCEHGDHPAPPLRRFCSLVCQLCENADAPEGRECAGICTKWTAP